MKVSYNAKGGSAQRYVCGAFSDRVGGGCISFGGMRIDVRALEEQLAQHNTEPAIILSPADRKRLLALGHDLPRAWDSVGASVETRKKILRLLIEEIVVDVTADKIELIVHWHGGDHTRLSVKKNKAGQNRWATDADVVELVRILARQLPDESIAAILNRSGKSTGRGNSWTRSRVLPCGSTSRSLLTEKASAPSVTR